jgi:hypothetical protein
MKITTHLLIAAILLFSSGCDENENKNEAAAEWPSFWTSEPGHDTWPYQYSSYQKYEIASTYSEASLKSYLNVYDNRINFQAYDSSTHFLALQVMIYSKEEKQAMQVCSSLSYIYPSEDENSAYLYIALAPENFDEELLNSKRWKLYIESRSEHSSGAYKIRKIIPGYAYGDSGMKLSLQNKNDNQGTPYLSFADSSDFEIRIYSHLVENPPKS